MAPTQDPNSVGGGAKKDEATLKVPSKDPKKKDEKKDEDLVKFLLSRFFYLSNPFSTLCVVFSIWVHQKGI